MKYPDKLRDAVYAEAMRQQLDARQLSEKCGGIPTADHIDSYLTGVGTMISSKVDLLLHALRMRAVGTFDPFKE